jgi:hypothetical protein
MHLLRSVVIVSDLIECGTVGLTRWGGIPNGLDDEIGEAGTNELLYTPLQVCAESSSQGCFHQAIHSICISRLPICNYISAQHRSVS